MASAQVWIEAARRECSFITTEQAAYFLGLSRRTLEFWRHEGCGPPFYRMGRRKIVYRFDDLLPWLMQSAASLEAPSLEAPSLEAPSLEAPSLEAPSSEASSPEASSPEASACHGEGS